MEQIKIVAMVKFNASEAFVLSRSPEFLYEKTKDGKYLFANDGPFYSVYHHDSPSGAFYAFGGAKFDIQMRDGTVEHAYGQWWDGGAQYIGLTKGILLIGVTWKTEELLKKCYVFSGSSGDVLKIQELRKSYTGSVFEYRDYEKIIKYEDMRHESFKREWKLEKAKEALIKEVKAKHKVIEDMRETCILSTWGDR